MSQYHADLQGGKAPKQVWIIGDFVLEWESSWCDFAMEISSGNFLLLGNWIVVQLFHRDWRLDVKLFVGSIDTERIQPGKLDKKMNGICRKYLDWRLKWGERRWGVRSLLSSLSGSSPDSSSLPSRVRYHCQSVSLSLISRLGNG
jgi:hypothetical protein